VAEPPTEGMFEMSAFFFTAMAYYQLLEQEFWLQIIPGVRIRVRAPILLEVHKYFTRHRRPAKPSVTEVATSIATQIATSAATKIATSAAIEIAKSTAMEIAKSSAAESVSDATEQKEDWLLKLPGLTVQLRGFFPHMAKHLRSKLKTRQKPPPC
jgi:hypothetical protein